MAKFTIKNPYSGATEDITTFKTTYVNNNNLAIQMCCEGLPYAMLTVNLDEKLEEDLAYVDTNNLPNAEEIIKSNNLGVFMGEHKRSGFCVYPLYKFYLDVI